MTTRPYRPEDRPRALQVLKDHRAIDSPTNRILITHEAAHNQGLALWTKPDAGDTGCLATLHAPENRRLFYHLALAACNQAIHAGLTRGTFTIHDQRLLDRLQRDFSIQPVPQGRHPNTGRPVEWTVDVDLHDARRQLERALA
jgi:hypothetical protein